MLGFRSSCHINTTGGPWRISACSETSRRTTSSAGHILSIQVLGIRGGKSGSDCVVEGYKRVIYVIWSLENREIPAGVGIRIPPHLILYLVIGMLWPG